MNSRYSMLMLSVVLLHHMVNGASIRKTILVESEAFYTCSRQDDIGNEYIEELLNKNKRGEYTGTHPFIMVERKPFQKNGFCGLICPILEDYRVTTEKIEYETNVGVKSTLKMRVTATAHFGKIRTTEISTYNFGAVELTSCVLEAIILGFLNEQDVDMLSRPSRGCAQQFLMDVQREWSMTPMPVRDLLFRSFALKNHCDPYLPYDRKAVQMLVENTNASSLSITITKPDIVVVPHSRYPDGSPLKFHDDD